MADVDAVKLERIQQQLAAAQLDAVVVRLAENVLSLTGFFPNVGYSAALATREGQVVLIAPEQEQRWTERAWASRTSYIKGMWQLPHDPASVQLKRMATQEIAALGLSKARVGWDGSFEYIAPPMLAGEPTVPDAAWQATLQVAVSGGELVDASETLNQIRAIKSPRDIEKLRIANDIAGMGLKAWVEAANMPGTTDAQAAAAAEAAVYAQGVGYQGTIFAKGYAQVASGQITGGWSYYLPSTQKRIEPGEFVFIELGVCADGYWSDLTRTIVVGEPSERQREIWQIQQQAFQTGVALMCPGASCFEIDARTREALGEYAPTLSHHTGHGMGLKYHEPYPLLSPQSSHRLEAGHALAFEPAIYLKGWGGLRIEDNLVITSEGAEYLSTFPRTLSGAEL
jgi:Xaa-Pro aminopeptidase